MWVVLNVKNLCASVFCALLLYSAQSFGQRYERDFQEAWCGNKGETEVVLSDRTRVDCLTASHAIEFDWASKWAEAIGQSLYYAIQTQKRAGIVLILKKPSDVRHVRKLETVIEFNALPIDVWLINADWMRFLRPE